MSNEIPHIRQQIEYLTAIEAGKVLEWRARKDTCEFVMRWISSQVDHPGWASDFHYEFREVRREQYIPRVRVPRALDVEPALGDTYWTITAYTNGGVYRGTWLNSELERACFANGMCFATEQDARDVWAAITARKEEGE